MACSVPHVFGSQCVVQWSTNKVQRALVNFQGDCTTDRESIQVGVEMERPGSPLSQEDTSRVKRAVAVTVKAVAPYPD